MIEHDRTGLPERYNDALFNNEQNQRAGMFITLKTLADEEDYRQWAREHYKPEDEIISVWHPVVVDECLKIIKEFINGNGI